MIGLKRGLFVGRFQPFHKGHLEAVKYILERVDEVIIGVGSPQYSHRLDDPFTAGERIVMIRRSLIDKGISPSRFWIIPIPDLHVHMLWVSQVLGYTPKFEVVYSNEPLTRRLFIEAGFKVESIPLFNRGVYSATEVRRRMLSGEDWTVLVPKAVAESITEFGGVDRIKALTKSDKPT